jgi:hypothetical protein
MILIAIADYEINKKDCVLIIIQSASTKSDFGKYQSSFYGDQFR